MNTIINKLIPTVALLLITHTGFAAINFQFSPTLTSGSDPNGLANATWTFAFEVTQPTYQLSGNFNDISFASDSAQVTISGATNPTVNGTHSITSGDASGDFVFIADFFGSTVLALQGPGNTVSSFSFAGVSVSGFGPVAPSFGSPSVGDLVDLAPFNALTFSQGSFTVSTGTFSYTTTPVPEPSSYALLGGALALAVALTRRSR